MRLSVILGFLAAVLAVGTCQNEPGAIWMPSPHMNTGRGGQTARWLIIHGTAGGSSAEAIGSWFQNPQSQAATHYVVGQNGNVVQCVLEANTAWGNGRIEAGADPWWSNYSPNQVTISIEHVKSSTDNSNFLTTAQKTASFRLIRNILNRNPGIQPRWADSSSGITAHYSISPSSRARCPGPFPWEEMFDHLNGRPEQVYCAGYVTADSLNIRSQPNSQSSIVGAVKQGRMVYSTRKEAGESIGGNNSWFFIGNGYVSGYYLMLQTPKPSWCV